MLHFRNQVSLLTIHHARPHHGKQRRFRWQFMQASTSERNLGTIRLGWIFFYHLHLYALLLLERLAMLGKNIRSQRCIHTQFPTARRRDHWLRCMNSHHHHYQKPQTFHIKNQLEKRLWPIEQAIAKKFST